MAITARSGPDVSFGAIIAGSTNGATGYATTGGYNDQRSPDVSDLGFAMMDPRAAYQYQPAGAVTNPVMAFYNSQGFYDFIPVAASSVAIVSNTGSSGLASQSLTLQSASTGRGTYSISIIAPETGNTVGPLLTPDSSGPQFNSFGQSGTINIWNAGFGAGRCVGVYTSTSGDSPITIHGRDVYGYKISETIPITATGSPTSSYGGIGQKAFKFITAVYNSSTPVSSGIAIGFTDRFGMPLYCPYAGMNVVVRLSSSPVNSAVAPALSSANFSIGSTAATQTSTTPDVRGLYISTTALTTNYRLQIQVIPAASAAAAMSVTDMSPLFGGMQYSS